ncbi:adenosylhomocysteinase, partial [Haloarcula sp. AONF1]
RDRAANGDAYDAGGRRGPGGRDREVGDIKLAAEGVEYDALSDEQREYMGSWEHGT